jgi:tRNA (guanine37-N1)-methyltransferase
MARLIEGFSKTDILREDSFSNDNLEAYSYTRPEEFNGKKVPDVLLNGDHRLIKRFIRKNSLELTMKNRKDLFENISFEDLDIELLTEILNAECNPCSSSQ